FYEGFRNRQGETTGATVPSLKQRNGDFSERCDARRGESFDSAGLCSNPAHQLYLEITNPLTPFPLNELPPPFISPFSQNLLSLFPKPNSGLNTFVTTQTKRDDFNEGGIRIDHYLTANDNLNFRYMISDGTRFDPLSPAGASVPGFPIGENHRAQNFVAQETHTFSPALVGVARFSFLRNKSLFGERTNHTPPSDLGFNYQPSLDVPIGPPFIQINGYTSIVDPITGPSNSVENT